MSRNKIHLPRNRYARVAMGFLLILGGLVGFLPIVGFWMIPVGAYVLSHDFPVVRRQRRRITAKYGRKLQGWCLRWRPRVRRG